MTSRVLLVVDSYPPVVGGSEIEAQRVAAGMIQGGHRVEVVCAGGGPMPKLHHWVDPKGIPVRILTRHSRGRVKDVLFALRVAWVIWRGRRHYDAVYFLMQGLHLATGLQVAHALKLPMVVKIAGSKVIPYMRESRAGRWELDWMQKWGVRLLVLNEGMMEEAVADGFSREQITWMPNPVDMNEFRPAQPGEAAAWRARQKLPADALIVIYVGRLSPEKGLRELLAGFAKAVEETPRAVLTLVGDGPQRAELEALARELKLGPDQVRFVGAVPVEQVPEWLRTSDVFALVSPAEGFSCALLEAMAAGLPPVITDIPANRQLVDPGVQGIAVPVGDTEALGGAFSRLFSDPALRLRLGAAARAKVVENYSTELVVQRYEQLFAELSGTP